jgi:hypothetical protein
MGDAVWIVVAVLGLGCAVVVWRIARSRRPGDTADGVPSADEAAAAVAPKFPPATPSAVVAEVPPAAPQAAAPVAPVAPVPAAAPAPATVLAPPKLKPPPPAPAPAPAPAVTVSPAVARAARFDLLEDQAPEPVLRLERAGAAQWEAAAALDATPVQRDALARLLVHAGRLEAVAVGNTDVYALSLRRASALALARGRLVGLAGGGLRSQPPHALDSVLAAQAAAVMLALRCSPAYLQGLRARVSEAKAVSATLHPKLLAQNEGKLKSLLQDLTRYLREAEENYAGAVRKPVFIARVGETCGQAAAYLQSAQEAGAALRSALETQARASRFGEVQLEKALAALRELQGQRRVLDTAARVLAGWQVLRLALGDAAAGAAAALRDAARTLDAAEAADRKLAATLENCLETAKLPDYVGKAEFIANRNASRELLKRIAAEPFAPAVQQLGEAAAAIDAGFAGDAALALLLRLDVRGEAVELRVPHGAG